ncbi:unnamed protein product [Caenorhabditis angaria]|uniref:TIL domain-containing protein n=1 Tax=Caenorhabditis angaria TaxID=860376 RepID=A0A9P1MVU9_9PELO|nr:unnamed protein product [Caenorhabditis angaria]
MKIFLYVFVLLNFGFSILCVYPPFRPRCRYDKECAEWCGEKRHLPDRIPDCYVHRCYCIEKHKNIGKFEKEEKPCKHKNDDCFDNLFQNR